MSDGPIIEEVADEPVAVRVDQLPVTVTEDDGCVFAKGSLAAAGRSR